LVDVVARDLVLLVLAELLDDENAVDEVLDDFALQRLDCLVVFLFRLVLRWSSERSGIISRRTSSTVIA
jgi:hypothetical protein